MSPSKWTTANIPDQSGKLAIITGASSGIGYEAARAMAGKGGQVILAVRSPEKGETAARTIHAEHSQAQLYVMVLDLSDLSSVRHFAEEFLKLYKRLDILINNAGVMAIPLRRSADGFELQFATNHLGHFALTGLLTPAITATRAARVVTVSSANHQVGWVNFDDLNAQKRYNRWLAYNQSKLANLLFAYELQRRLAASHIDAISVACHPGFTSTNLQLVGAKMDGSRITEAIFRFAQLFGQSQPMGALPTLYAAVAPDVQGGDYIGPTGFGGLRGYPEKVRSSQRSHDPASARKLWEISETLTGVRYKFSNS